MSHKMLRPFFVKVSVLGYFLYISNESKMFTKCVTIKLIINRVG